MTERIFFNGEIKLVDPNLFLVFRTIILVFNLLRAIANVYWIAYTLKN